MQISFLASKGQSGVLTCPIGKCGSKFRVFRHGFQRTEIGRHDKSTFRLYVEESIMGLKYVRDKEHVDVLASDFFGVEEIRQVRGEYL